MDEIITNRSATNLQSNGTHDLVKTFGHYKYPANVSTFAMVDVVKLESRDKLHLGDKVTPLSWYNGTIVFRGTRKTDVMGTYLNREINGYSYYNRESYDGVYHCVPFDTAYNYSSLTSPGPLSPEADYAISDKKALKKLQQRKLDVGTIIAELSSSVSYFARYAFQGATLLHAIRHGKWDKVLIDLGISKRKFKAANAKARRAFATSGIRNSGEYAKAIAGQVATRNLELQFAIKPMLNDINDYNLLVAEQLKHLQTAIFAVKGRNMRKVDHYDNVYVGDVCTTMEYRISQCAITKLYVQVDDLEKQLQKSLGLEHYLRPVWEMVPYSWLLDYVIDIGDFLDAVMATMGLTFIHGYHSTRTMGIVRKITSEDSTDAVVPARNVFVLETQAAYINTYRRATLEAFPHPRISFVLDDISEGKITNVISLAVSLATGRRRDIGLL
jgi:hypothetical protein